MENKIIPIKRNGELKAFKIGNKKFVDEETTLDREKIGEESKEKLREAETVKDIKEYLARIHDIDLQGGDK